MIENKLSQYSDSLSKFELTIALLNEKKLNKNNAFEHRIIDEINILFSNPSVFFQGHENLWQKYSIAVSSVGKIYGYCVEHVYGELISFLSGIKSSIPTEKIFVTEEKKVKIFHDTLAKESSVDRSEPFPPLEENKYFKSIANKSMQENICLGFLNNLQITQSLDLDFGNDKVVQGLEIEKIELNTEGLLNFSLNELNELHLLKDSFEENEKYRNEYVFQQNSPSSEEIPILNEESRLESGSSSLTHRLETIQFFDDFNYIRPKENERTIKLKELTKRKQTKNKPLENFKISEENIPIDNQVSECMITGSMLNKWKNEPPEINLNENFSSFTFFNLETRPFTKLIRSSVDFHVENIDSDGENAELLNVNQENEENSDNNFLNFISIRDIKKNIFMYLKNQQKKSYEMNEIKEKSVKGINNSLFFVAILHLCNDYGYHLRTLQNDLHLIVN